MDMSLSFHAAPRAAKPWRRLAPAATVAMLAVVAALMGSLAWRGAGTESAAPAATNCADLLRNASELQLIGLAREPVAGGLVCSLQRAPGR